METAPDMASDVAAQLKGSALAAGGAAGQMREQRTEEDCRDETETQLAAVPRRVNDRVRPGTDQIELHVHEHNQEAGRRHKVEKPFIFLTESCDKCHAVIEQRAQNATDHADHQCENNPPEDIQHIVLDKKSCFLLHAVLSFSFCFWLLSGELALLQ